MKACGNAADTTRASASDGVRATHSVDSPAADTRTSRSTRVSNESASSAPMKPPIELPTTDTLSTPSASHIASTVLAYPRIEIGSAGISEAPKPGRSSARQRCVLMNAVMLSRKTCHFELRPCRNSSGGPLPPVSSTFTRRPPRVPGWYAARAAAALPASAASSQAPSVAVGVGRVRARTQDSVARRSSEMCARGRPHRSYRINGLEMNIAIDIDSALHRCSGPALPPPPGAASGSTCPTRTSSRGASRELHPSRCAPASPRRTPRRP